jgi:small subunit ribosomal protein S23
MPARRIPSQVHQQTARLLRSNYLKFEPAWYQAVLDHPPLPLPPRAPAPRTAYDKDRTKNPDGRHEVKPVGIYYTEDRLRRQFFKDHPFEAYRPRTLVEGGRVEEEHPIRGTAWTRLRQRGRNPRPEECVSRPRVYTRLLTCARIAQLRALRGKPV